MSPKCRPNTASGPFSRLGRVGPPKAILALLAATLLALALPACGSGGEAELLPGETAEQIKANLGLVEELVAAGDCVGAENAAAAVSDQVAALEGVDAELVTALEQGAARLNEVVGECDEGQEEDERAEEEADAEQLEEEDQRAEERARNRSEREAEREQKKEEREERQPPAKEPKEPEEQETPETPETGGGTPSGGVAPATPAEGGE